MHLQLAGVALDQVAERVVGRRPGPGRSGPSCPSPSACILALLLFRRARSARSTIKTPSAWRIWAALRRPIRAGGGVCPVGGGPSPGRAPDARRIKMGKIVVSQNVTLNGVVEDPSGEAGFRHGGWFVQFMGQDWEAWAELELAEAQGAEALLMGRRSDEYFGARSSMMSGEWLDSLNRLPKYVVSATLQEPRWTNATVLAGEVVSEVSKLRQQIQGEIVVYASRPLVRTLMEHDLVRRAAPDRLPGCGRRGRAPVRRDQRQATPAPDPHEDRGERPRPPDLRARPRGLNSRAGHLRDDRGRRSRRDDHPGILVAAPRKRGRRGSSEPPPTYAPTQPPGRGDGDRQRSHRRQQ